MTSIAKLKDRARKHEQKEDWDAAIQAYQQVLASEEGDHGVELELGLFNRIGDLYLRLGQTEEAVSYYVTAADKYADSGFFNNAIALCNKALRHRPGKTEVYLKLSGLYAQQGFFTDARRWILEYSEREMRAGNGADAVTALAEFVDRSDDPEVREILAEHLASRDRGAEAVEQLERAHQQWLARGQAGAAERAMERARALDPGAGGQDGQDGQERPRREPSERSEAPSGDLAAELEPREEALPGEVEGSPLEGLEPTQLGAEEGESEPTGLPGLEVSRPHHDSPDPEAELPEDSRPLPLLDTGFGDDVESPPAHAHPEASAQTQGELAKDENREEDEPGAFPLLDLGSLGMAGDGADLLGSEAVDPVGPELTAFELEIDIDGERKVSADLDLDAILDRAKQQVSRGLGAEALAELRLLANSDAGPDVFRDALTVVNEIVRHNANDLNALQRRVEYASRIGEADRLADAYMDLGDALGRLGAESKARAMYERVLDIDPENEVAREALGVSELGDAEHAEDPRPAPGAAEAEAAGHEDGEAGGHFDQGLAFKEMGLLDEAIAEFRAAVAEGTETLEVYEELGKCFILKGQFTVAIKVFRRALTGPYPEEERLGVYYHLGQSHEELGQRAEAREVYERILAVDPAYADVSRRMGEL